MNSDQINRQLWAAAQLQAARFGYGFGSDCEDHMRGFIRDGVTKINAEGKATKPAWISLAEHNVMAFTARMVIEAQQLNLDELRETTYWKARDFFCPLWPFC